MGLDGIWAQWGVVPRGGTSDVAAWCVYIIPLFFVPAGKLESRPTPAGERPAFAQFDFNNTPIDSDVNFLREFKRKISGNRNSSTEKHAKYAKTRKAGVKRKVAKTAKEREEEVDG